MINCLLCRVQQYTHQGYIFSGYVKWINSRHYTFILHLSPAGTSMLCGTWMSDRLGRYTYASEFQIFLLQVSLRYACNTVLSDHYDLSDLSQLIPLTQFAKQLRYYRLLVCWKEIVIDQRWIMCSKTSLRTLSSLSCHLLTTTF